MFWPKKSHLSWIRGFIRPNLVGIDGAFRRYIKVHKQQSDNRLIRNEFLA